MIKLISDKVACYLCKDEDCKDNYGLYEYAVYIILSSLFHIATIIVLGLCFNLLVESLMFYFSFISIRKFAGGYHAKTPTKCYLFSVVSVIIVLSLIELINTINSCVVMIVLTVVELFCVVLIFMISPLDTENNPLNSDEKKVYKKKACVISIGSFILSLLFAIFNSKGIGASLGMGIVMSVIVLVMRKIEMVFNAKYF